MVGVHRVGGGLRRSLIRKVSADSCTRCARRQRQNRQRGNRQERRPHGFPHPSSIGPGMRSLPHGGRPWPSSSRSSCPTMRTLLGAVGWLMTQISSGLPGGSATRNALSHRAAPAGRPAMRTIGGHGIAGQLRSSRSPIRTTRSNRCRIRRSPAPRAGERSLNTVVMTDFLTRPERSSHRPAATERRMRNVRSRSPLGVSPARSRRAVAQQRGLVGHGQARQASCQREAAKQMAPKGRGGAAAHVFQRQPLAEPALRHRGTTRTNARKRMASSIFQANGPAKDAKRRGCAGRGGQAHRFAPRCARPCPAAPDRCSMPDPRRIQAFRGDG